MNIEVERKRHLSCGSADLAERIVAAGYCAGGTADETDTYFSRTDVDYLETVECLRVRRRGDFAEITYKPASDGLTHGKDDIIAKPETNVTLASGSDSAAACALLVSIGMVKLVQVRKTRTTYRHPAHAKILIVIDEIAGLGTFAETEVTDADPIAAARTLEETEHSLGLDQYPVVSAPYRDLLLAQARR